MEVGIDLERIPPSTTGVSWVWSAAITGQRERAITELEAVLASGAIEQVGFVIRAYNLVGFIGDDPRFLAILDELGLEP